MRTYDGYGEFNSSTKTAVMNLSLPANSYDFTFYNISKGGRNGLVINLKVSGTDPGTPLVNSSLNFFTLTIDLSAVPTVSGVSVDEFDYNKPFFVYIHHDNDTCTYGNNARDCYDDLSDYNTLDKKNNKKFDESPARRGFGGLKKV